MTRDEAEKIKEMYQQLDEAARAAKKHGDYKKAAEYVSKRNTLYPKFLEAVNVLQKSAQGGK